MRIYWKTFNKKWVRPKKNQFPIGSIVFKGFQGSGKTLSLVHYVIELQKQFPNCLIYSNVHINGLSNYTYIDSDLKLKEALVVQNGQRGVAVVLDEAHLYFGKKSGIPLDVLSAISQQRKDRRRIIFTSQIWEELDISLRKQVKDIVSCRCVFGMFQFNQVYDGETLTWDKFASSYTAQKKYSYIFKHSIDLYSRYDTFQRILTNDSYITPKTTPSLSGSYVVTNNQKNRLLK